MIFEAFKEGLRRGLLEGRIERQQQRTAIMELFLVEAKSIDNPILAVKVERKLENEARKL